MGASKAGDYQGSSSGSKQKRRRARASNPVARFLAIFAAAAR